MIDIIERRILEASPWRGRKRFKAPAARQVREEFQEYQHPRGPDGKFISAGVETKSWDDTPEAQWAKAKIHELEKQLANGDKEGLMNAVTFQQAQQHAGKHISAVLTAQDNLIDQYNKKLLGKVTDEAAEFAADELADLTSKSSAAKPFNIDHWQQLGGKLGTENGGTFESASGQKYYVKLPDNPDRARNEVLALKLYEKASGNVVQSGLVEYNGKLGIATPWMEGATKADWASSKSREEASKDFASHAWLANWDAVGAGSENPMDNIKHDGAGTLRLVDAGGALEFRGMGGAGKKPDGSFTDSADDWNTLRKASINPSSAAVFGDMTPEQLRSSAAKVTNVSDESILFTVDRYHGGTYEERRALAAKLIARRDNIGKRMSALDGLIAKGEAAKSQVVGVGIAVPPPPIINQPSYASYQKKVNTIHEMAVKGDIAGVEAIETNAASTAYYIKKTHKYKQDVLTALKSGGKAAPLGSYPQPVKATTKAAAVTSIHDALAGIPLRPRAGKGAGHWKLVHAVEPTQLPEVLKPNQQAKWLDYTQRKELESKGEGVYKGLTKGAKENIYGYTESDYGIVNDGLRDAHENETAPQPNVAKYAKDFIKASIEIPNGTLLNRRHYNNSNLIENLKPGMIVADPGLLSTSTDQLNNWSGDVEWHMEVGEGVKGLPVNAFSANKGEQEVVLPPNTRLVVLSVLSETKGDYIDKKASQYVKHQVRAKILPYHKKQWP